MAMHGRLAKLGPCLILIKVAQPVGCQVSLAMVRRPAMMKLITFILVAAVAFAAPAFADQDLAGHRVSYEFVGNTIKGEYRSCGPRMDFFEYYDASGAIRGKERRCGATGNWKHYEGKWEVKEGKFCVAYGTDRASGCWTYTAVPGGIRRQGAGAEMEDRLVILSGNPEKL
jgi:hypothetical protein